MLAQMSEGRDLRGRLRAGGRALARAPARLLGVVAAMFIGLGRLFRRLPMPARRTRRRWGRRFRREAYSLWLPLELVLGAIGGAWIVAMRRAWPQVEAAGRKVQAGATRAWRWGWPRLLEALSPLAPVVAPIVERLAPGLQSLWARARPAIERWAMVARLRWSQPAPRVRERAGPALWRLIRALVAWPAEEIVRWSQWVRAGHWQPVAMVAIFFALIAFWVTWPAWLSGPDKVLIGGGENPDWTGTAWAYWWTAFSLENRLNPFNGLWNFYPVGWRPVAMYNLLDGLMGAPFLVVFGPVLGYNLFAVFTLWSTAMATWLFARAQGLSRGAALVAGLALETSNFLLFELRDGRLSQTLLVFWILALMGLERLSRGVGTWRLAVFTGLAVAATHLIYWYNGFFLILCATPFWLAEWRRWDLARFRRLALAAGVTLAVVGPYLVSLARHFRMLPGVERELESWMDYGELGRGVFGLNSAIRHSHWPLWPFIHPHMEPDDHRVQLAILVLALGGLLWRRVRGQWRWLAAMGVGWVLTLGPYLKLYDDEPTPIRLPYLLFYDTVPFFNRLWWPGRMALIFLVPLFVLAAIHLDRLAARLPRLRTAIIALVGAAVIADADGRNPFMPVSAREPHTYDATFYEQLDGALITTPVLGRDPAGRHHLWFQIFHQRPILYGLGAHIPGHRPLGYEAYIRNNSLLDALAVVSDSLTKSVTVLPRDVDTLMKDGFRWVVVDANAFTEDYAQAYFINYTQVMALLYGPPDVQSSKALAWRLRRLNSSVVVPPLPPAGPESFGKAPQKEDED